MWLRYVSLHHPHELPNSEEKEVIWTPPNWDNSFSAYAKLSGKLTFLTSWDVSFSNPLRKNPFVSLSKVNFQLPSRILSTSNDINHYVVLFVSKVTESLGTNCVAKPRRAPRRVSTGNFPILNRLFNPLSYSNHLLSIFSATSTM